MRIIFMGTPDFAVASLRALIEAGKNVVAVVTSPDKPAGRGQKLKGSAVKEYASTLGIPILQPEKLKNEHFVEELRSFQADLQIVVAFRMLPEIVWNMPRLGTINVHASLLPQYRGAAPIHHAILNGEKETGVTTFLLQHEIDTGHILFSDKVQILDEDNTGSLYEKLMHIGARLLIKTVEELELGTVIPSPQTNFIAGTDLKLAPKIFKEDCLIDWSMGIEKCHNQIRGLSPIPGAFTLINGKILKIFKSSKLAIKHNKIVGSWETDGKTSLTFACPDGLIYIEDLQLEGKKRMQITEFLRGNPI